MNKKRRVDTNRGRQKKQDSARIAVCRVLYDVLEKGAFANLSSIYLLNHIDLDERDRRFASAMINGTLAYLPTIDYFLEKKSKIKPEKLNAWVRIIIRFGIYQIYYANSVPASAAVNESVNLAYYFAPKSSIPYVNAVLRSITKGQPYIPQKKQGIAHAMPSELFGLFKKQYGLTEAIAISEAALANQQSLTVRVNQLKTTVALCQESLEKEGVEVEAGFYLPEALRLKLKGKSIQKLQAFQEGWMSVQDEAAMLISHLVKPESATTILDLCAAPGGKTISLIEQHQAQGQYLACDLLEHRLAMMEENISRLNLAPKVTLLQLDATSVVKTQLPEAFKLGSDIVLVDVPCSGLGLLGRKPEIKLKMNYEEINKLCDLQKDILDHAARLVRQGGELLYSTCTINKMENEAQIERFLKSEAGQNYQRVDIREDLPESLQMTYSAAEQLNFKEGFIQLLNHKQKTDGFFIAKLKRIS